MSHFVASGDSGAYTCGVDQPPAGSFPSTLPTVTAVGGTTVFESQQGTYFKEMAWGGPLDESGGGGGASQFYAAPSYQQSVLNSSGHGLRQVPDVAADADPSTGFHIVFGGQDGQVGGTSAATPLWAGTIALVNQDLINKGLREVGFANPALYWMGQNASTLPARPFHDVTTGNNLAFDAGSRLGFRHGMGQHGWSRARRRLDPLHQRRRFVKERGPDRRQGPGRRAGETGARLLQGPPLVNCPHCESVVPAGDFCGHCGAHLITASTSRTHAFAAVPSERVAHPSIISTLFPHLPHRRGGAFRWALICRWRRGRSCWPHCTCSRPQLSRRLSFCPCSTSLSLRGRGLRE